MPSHANPPRGEPDTALQQTRAYAHLRHEESNATLNDQLNTQEATHLVIFHAGYCHASTVATIETIATMVGSLLSQAPAHNPAPMTFDM